MRPEAKMHSRMAAGRVFKDTTLARHSQDAAAFKCVILTNSL